VITQLILMIPVVGIIMALVWAFSDDTNKNKQNLMLACLIIAAVMLGIFVLFGILFSIL
jgi:chromate transport protein ChrA